MYIAILKRHWETFSIIANQNFAYSESCIFFTVMKTTITTLNIGVSNEHLRDLST